MFIFVTTTNPKCTVYDLTNGTYLYDKMFAEATDIDRIFIGCS